VILSDKSILARHYKVPLIQPFFARQVAHGMSYGLGPAGYDVRIAERHIMPPGAFALASIMEWMRLPNDLAGMVMNKSSWVRKGLDAAKTTIIEPGWYGFLTLELSNLGRDVLDIPAGAPIAQIVFQQLDQPVDKPYAGKYQDQPAYPVEAIDEPAQRRKASAKSE